MSEWAASKVVGTLLGDAVGLRNKLWVARYFAARRVRPLGWLAPGSRNLEWRTTGTKLTVSSESGALSAWYEVAHVKAYAPVADFIPQAGWTVVDVGANIGAYATWAARFLGPTGQLVAIEPNPISFRHLKASLAGLPCRTHMLDVAASDTDTEMTLHFRRGFTGTSSLSRFADATDSVPVRVQRLDRMAHELDIEHIDLIKLDVEGAEADALKGAEAILSVTDRVVLETTADAIGANVRRILDHHNFELVHERRDVWDVDGLQILCFRRGT